MTTRQEIREIGAMVLTIADDLDGRGYNKTGPLHRAVRVLTRLLLLIPDEDLEDPCLQCGGPVVQSGRGPRRVYCKGACRSAAWRERHRRNERVTSGY